MIFFQNLYILGSLEGEQKKLETDQKIVKKKLVRLWDRQKFFLVNQIIFWSTKKMEK